MDGTNALQTVSEIDRAIVVAATVEEIRHVEAAITGIETAMKSAGLYSTAEIRPYNEAKMWARRKLGELLAEVERGAGPGRGKKVSSVHTSFRSYIKQLGLDKMTAMEAQRIAAMPMPELEKMLAIKREADTLCTFAELVKLARPYWYAASRRARHEAIASGAQTSMGTLGPFPLIYADPPWLFEIYSEKGKERTADQHYDTLTDQEIIDFKINGSTVPEISTKAAVLFLWCTSSNIVRALDVMNAWGFEYKTQAVWTKDKTGLGLVFRNKHEVLLYGTRGAMPGPQYQPSSVFDYPRGKHSAKPPEVRAAIEKMYPDFDTSTRLEMFARERVEGWTGHGYES